MLNIDILRKEFDEFLEKHNCEMTDDEVLKKAMETEEKMFTE